MQRSFAMYAIACRQVAGCIIGTTTLYVCTLLHRKDVRLPVQLQRAMAAEAEATREARAKVCSLHQHIHHKLLYSYLICALCESSAKNVYVRRPTIT